ncbi:homoserine O-succinyltransferase [Oleiagrimonas sp. MCCC 1A03011]|uniref:homoserine O-succinyltransferase MetX n=1 Tax=Oleiagrimonas sp. MCCC 1A03011 TaxID=1926883 RepID=UPI000DC3D046|nr:homoserine O-succinyltransferase [Oleiagrimonas sp. MCCC 1A03011]RAP58461.1 alpha/beta hydrolase [Oleiagrimonas sp. MCCC 1A03011]
MTLQAVPTAEPPASLCEAGGLERNAFPFQRHVRHVRFAPRHAEGACDVAVRYLWIGAPGAPTVIVQGGISADRDVCASEAAPRDGWWQALVGVDRAIDLRRCRVLAIDWLDAQDLGASAVSTADQADALAALLDALQIGRAQAFIGASYGAMVGLAFAARHGHRVGHLVALAGAHRPHPLATAQRSVQREIVRFGLRSGEVDRALALARQLALTTYRGSEEFATRFSGEARFADGRFRLPVEDWLEHNGRRFVERFDAHRYLSLSESIDLHAVDPSAVRVPTTLIGFATDRLVPLADLCMLQRALGAPATLEVIETVYGHDGFLKETARLAPLLRETLNACCGA